MIFFFNCADIKHLYNNLFLSNADKRHAVWFISTPFRRVNPALRLSYRADLTFMNVRRRKTGKHSLYNLWNASGGFNFLYLEGENEIQHFNLNYAVELIYKGKGQKCLIEALLCFSVGSARELESNENHQLLRTAQRRENFEIAALN